VCIKPIEVEEEVEQVEGAVSPCSAASNKEGREGELTLTKVPPPSSSLLPLLENVDSHRLLDRNLLRDGSPLDASIHAQQAARGRGYFRGSGTRGEEEAQESRDQSQRLPSLLVSSKLIP
jgi:hypothetical protein